MSYLEIHELIEVLLQARVEAGGLRKKLERYTQEGEAADPQLLTIALKKCR